MLLKLAGELRPVGPSVCKMSVSVCRCKVKTLGCSTSAAEPDVDGFAEMYDKTVVKGEASGR